MAEIKKTKHHVQKPNLVALSSQEAQWVRLASSTNNLANANTPGFKSQLVKLTQTTQIDKNGEKVNFVNANKALRNLNDGSFRQTQNPLDVAITGNGYFMVDNGNGNFLTRNGQFAVSTNNELVTANGSYKVLNENGSPIAIPKNVKKLNILSNGAVHADTVFIGRLGVFSVQNQQEKLKSFANNLLKPIEQTPKISTNYSVKQFGLEESNVSPVRESILMIEILRQYEHAQKIIDDYEQSHKKMLNVSSKNV